MKLFKRLVEALESINSILWQIYGELNRTRLGAIDKRYAKKIMKFDKENNKYIPFFDSAEGYDNYEAAKSKEEHK